MRFVQGFAGAAGLVTARAVVRDLAQGREAIILYSRLAVVSGLAPVMAPVLGAVALAFVSWRGVFFGLAVLGAVTTVLVATMLHETHHPEHRTKGGFSATLSAFGSLLKDGAFTGYALVAGLTSIILFSYIASSSFVAQNVYGATPGQFAATFAANGIGLAALGQLNGRIAPRVGPLVMLKVGVIAQAAGMLLLFLFVILRLDFGDFSVFAFAVVLFIAIVPLGLLFPNTMAICMGQSAGRSGTASALLGVTTFLFGAAVSPIAGAGDPAVGMVIVMASASAVMLSLVFVLASRVKLVEE
jgi:DHA1 family bicyclomycin/chloramphenicol resistance-like MFS transporter